MSTITTPDTIVDIATPAAENTSDPTFVVPDAVVRGAVRIGRELIKAVTRRDTDPAVTELCIELILTAPTDDEALYISSEEREVTLQDKLPELAFTFEKRGLIVDGTIHIVGERDDGATFCNEVDEHLAAVEQALALVTLPGVHVDLSPGLLRGVTYQLQRGLADEAVLRRMFEYWKSQMYIRTVGLRDPFGDEIEKYVKEESFGFHGGDCQLHFAWFSAAEAREHELGDHAVILLDVQCGDLVAEKILQKNSRLRVHQALEMAAPICEALVRRLELEVLEPTNQLVDIVELVTPMDFWFGTNR